MNLLPALLVCLIPAQAEPTRLTWTVAGEEREAIVYAPAATERRETVPPPLVFAFHGHGGTMRHAARSFHLQTEWPEAVVVYMQGLPTPGIITDFEGKRTGWQHSPGAKDDRDLKFFDAVLSTMKKDYRIDERRIYSTGHSNGGAFTYLLWASRPDTFAAVAPSAAAGAQRFRAKMTPCPCLHFGGRDDPLVKFSWQEASMSAVRAINGCSDKPEPWGKPTPGSDDCLVYPSTKNAPFVSCIYDGGHEYHAEAPALIVRFFKEHTRAAAAAPTK